MKNLIFTTADGDTVVTVEGETIIQLIVELLATLRNGGIDLEEVQEVNIMETALAAHHDPQGTAKFFDYEPSESYTITVEDAE